MGWKASAIIINKPGRAADEQLLQEIGFSGLAKIKDEPFEVALDPRGKKVYIGSYKDNMIICTPDIPLQFFEDEKNSIENKLVGLFPNSDFCAIVLHSTVNLWGFSITKNGQKIRTKAGSSEDGTFVEFGQPQEEEKELLSKSKIGSNGNRIYVLDDFPDEVFSEDQVGEDFVFSICERYLGERIDSVDELLWGTKMNGYAYRKFVRKDVIKAAPHLPKQGDSKPWWKMW